MPFTGAGGQKFMSSVLAKASMPGGYTRTFQTPVQKRAAIRIAAPSGGMSTDALAAIQRAKAYYQSGGGFGKGVEAGLERGRIKATSAGMQNLVSAGLAGTTMAGGLGLKFEEEVAAPTRAGVESQRAQALSSIEMGQAGMIQSAGESSASRALQMYMANLQASLNGGRTTVGQPRAVQQPAAQQFPSLYGTSTGGNMPSVPDWTGGGTTSWAPPREYQSSMVGKSLWAQ